MAALPVVTYGESILRKVLEPAEDFEAIQNLVPNMFDTTVSYTHLTLPTILLV